MAAGVLGGAEQQRDDGFDVAGDVGHGGWVVRPVGVVDPAVGAFTRCGELHAEAVASAVVAVCDGRPDTNADASVKRRRRADGVDRLLVAEELARCLEMIMGDT
ncbi:hypothetical protein ZWY2020_000641 [Hordeum vulgare]|nr:hypothetical protein ZWY2020_000641 [Hordeum vulgare]